MEDASGIDLDWFWRGWFYSTDHVDLAIEDVKLFIVDQGDPDEAERNRKERRKDPSISEQRNQELPKRIDWQPGKRFYNSPDYDEFAVEESARKAYQKMLEELDDEQRSLLQRTTNFYVVKFAITAASSCQSSSASTTPIARMKSYECRSTFGGLMETSLKNYSFPRKRLFEWNWIRSARLRTLRHRITTGLQDSFEPIQTL